MAGWTKLFSSITTSSIWCADDTTLRVWVAMLASCDADGVVEGSIPGFANFAKVSIPDLERVLESLQGPDPYSRTQDNEGRRVEVIHGGWRILNYAAYRDRGQIKDGSRAPYMRKYRANVTRNTGLLRVTGCDLESVTRNTEAEAEAEAEERGEKKEASSSSFDDDASKPAASSQASPVSEASLQKPSASSASPLSADDEDSKILSEIKQVGKLINSCLKKIGNDTIKSLVEDQGNAIRARLLEPGWKEDLVPALKYIIGNPWFAENRERVSFDLITRSGKVQEYAAKSRSQVKSSEKSRQPREVKVPTPESLKARLGDHFETYEALIEFFPVPTKFKIGQDVESLIAILQDVPAEKLLLAAKLHHAEALDGNGKPRYMPTFANWIDDGGHLAKATSARGKSSGAASGQPAASSTPSALDQLRAYQAATLKGLSQ